MADQKMLHPRAQRRADSLYFSAKQALILAGALTTLVCSWTTPATANAGTSSIQTDRDALYFKAVLLLDKIDEATARYNEMRRNATPAQHFESERKEITTQVQSYLLAVVPLLQKSAEENNPVAQFRLGLLYSNYESRDQAVKQVCALYKASLSQGFAPAALGMTGYCFDDIEQAEFRSLVDALSDEENLYKQYFPQPAILFHCDTHRVERTAYKPMDAEGFRANLYMKLATEMGSKNLRNDQHAYLVRAAKHGCGRAIERLKTWIDH